MSQSPRIPVIYVFGKKPVDVDDCVNQFQKALQLSSDETGKERPVILRHDVAYTHQAVLISERLREVLEPHYMILYAEVPNKVYPTTSPSSPVVNEAFPENCSYLYIGGENLALTHLLMTHSDCDVISYSPPARSCRVESASPTANKLLMRRYAMIQKARDADVFGILVGTLGGSSYLSLIKHLRSLLRERSKKFYTISVGKLNPSKLANFMEIECFVLVACPENSLIDTKDFYRPIVTPYELEVALADDPAEAWLASGTTRAGGGYVLDFQKLLIAEGSSVSDAKGADAQCQNNEDKGSPGEDDDGDKPIFSLVTGKYRHPRRFGDSSPTSETNDEATASDGHTLIKTQHGELAMINDSAAGTFLREQRTYQGLDPRFGQDAPSTLEQGRSGIARGYGEVKSDS
ncbi:Diphthamide biosynthesis protein 2, variant 2 [Stygiomarasmius scandens]